MRETGRRVARDAVDIDGFAVVCKYSYALHQLGGASSFGATALCCAQSRRGARGAAIITLPKTAAAIDTKHLATMAAVYVCFVIPPTEAQEWGLGRSEGVRRQPQLCDFCSTRRHFGSTKPF